ncbi:uncharacterized protein LOC121737887 [Aricia agestis]|uniref:uncharacterized protein LOC121737887 n=1 Tax=Aricia agestis TaxID=91739 RepID=UPI001C207F50|nr:uncharacterized protein LOC121737887 [Aricia agestis]
MSSRKSEVEHERQLRGLLETAGLECTRPPPPSTVTSEEEGAAEEIIEVHSEHSEANIEKEEIEKEKDESVAESLTTPEEIPEMEADFPTASLRRLIPEQQRSIEEMNRIEVLPEEFPTNFDPESIPIVVQTPLVEVIDILGSLTGCRRYKSNLAEYWFLDTLANLLRRAQKDQMDRGSQAVLMSWFCEWMKEVQHFDAADRHRMITRFQDNITVAAKFIAHNNHLPTPEEVGITYKARYNQEQSNKEDNEAKTTDVVKKTGKLQAKKSDKGKKGKNDKNQSKKGKEESEKRDKSPIQKSKKDRSSSKDSKSPKKDKSPRKSPDEKDGSPSRQGDGSKGVEDKNEKEKTVKDEPENFECALVNLTNIAHYIYDLFSTDYQYNLLRMVFTFPPDYIQVDSPYQMRVPKTLMMQQTKKIVLDKEGTKTSLTKKERREDDYGKLLELQEREERSLADQESRDRAEWLRRSHILPLNAAVNNDSSRHLSAKTDNS